MSTIDKSNFKKVIQNYPNQFKKALEFPKDIKIEGKFSNMIICGMGGSALPADMVISYLKSKNINFPIIIARTYQLPPEANKQSLIIASSYSGNTEETINCLKEALSRKLAVIGASKGGEIEKYCFKYNLPHIRYPDDGPYFQPRCATGYSFTAFIMILSALKIVRGFKKEIIKLIKFLEQIRPEAKGKELAKKIKSKVPIIYTSDFYKDSIARIFKIKLNENSKTQAFYNYFPELNHNEMVGFTNLVAKYFVLMIQDPLDHPRIKKRMKITQELLNQKNIESEIIKMQGKTVLEKIFSTSLLTDWTSYYLALSNKQDPTPVLMVEDFKEKMKQ